MGTLDPVVFPFCCCRVAEGCGSPKPSSFFAKPEIGRTPFRVSQKMTTAMAFGGPRSSCVRPGAHSARRQDSRNDLTPCRMALHFVSAGTHASHSDETLGPTATRGSSHPVYIDHPHSGALHARPARRLRSLRFPMLLPCSLAPLLPYAPPW